MASKNVWNSGTGSNKHRDLAGLGEDDHTEYLRTDGNRPPTGIIDMTQHGLCVSNQPLVELRTEDMGIRPVGHALDTAFATEAAISYVIERQMSVRNSLATNLNASSDFLQFRSWDPSTYGGVVGSSFANVTSDGFELVEGGTYDVMCQMPIYSTVQRANIGLSITLDGQQKGPEASMAYIRSWSGHNESSLIVQSTPFTAVADQIISVQTRRLARTGTVRADAGLTYLTVCKIR